MPNVMVALPNIDGALCSMPQSLADAHYYMPCSNAAKTRNPLKFAGVPQTRQQISAISRPKLPYYEYMWRTYRCLTSFFSDCRYVPSLRRYRPTNCAMVPRWWLFGDFLGPAFPASRTPHVSDLHYKFTLGPHHVTKYGRHPIYGRWD